MQAAVGNNSTEASNTAGAVTAKPPRRAQGCERCRAAWNAAKGVRSPAPRASTFASGCPSRSTGFVQLARTRRNKVSQPNTATPGGAETRRNQTGTLISRGSTGQAGQQYSMRNESAYSPPWSGIRGFVPHIPLAPGAPERDLLRYFFGQSTTALSRISREWPLPSFSTRSEKRFGCATTASRRKRRTFGGYAASRHLSLRNDAARLRRPAKQRPVRGGIAPPGHWCRSGSHESRSRSPPGSTRSVAFGAYVVDACATNSVCLSLEVTCARTRITSTRSPAPRSTAAK